MKDIFDYLNKNSCCGVTKKIVDEIEIDGILSVIFLTWNCEGNYGLIAVDGNTIISGGTGCDKAIDFLKGYIISGDID